MLLLAFDTATPCVTAAVLQGAGRTAVVLAERTIRDARGHGELLTPAIAGVLGDAGVGQTQLDAIAVGVGPGPFTGLRVGVVTARVIGATLGVPVHGVCTLDALAYDATDAGLDGRFVVVTDARRREVYWAEYDVRAGGPRVLDGPHVGAPADVPRSVPAVGPGSRLYPQWFPDIRGPEYPRAGALGRWALAGQPVSEPVPLYLRRPDAAQPGPRKRVLR